MKAINDAYDQIQKERASGYSQTGNYDYQSNFPHIRELLKNKRFTEAEAMLDGVPISERTAEWFYLKGMFFNERRWYHAAYKHFETAYDKEPDNNEYRDAFNYIKTKSDGHYSKSGYNTFRNNSSDCSGCDICTGLMCANILCRCFNCC
jgi:molecular chaperone DnaJ